MKVEDDDDDDDTRQLHTSECTHVPFTSIFVLVGALEIDLLKDKFEF